MAFPRLSSLKDAESFAARLKELKLDLPFDERAEPAPEGPLAQPYAVYGKTVGNRFCILPMEGWDGTSDGRPTELTRRRWHNFGISGAKLIWGGEAVAVRHDGRANPNQLVLRRKYLSEFAGLRNLLAATHAEHFDTADDCLIGLQLTHSGRFARPNAKQRPEPRIGYRHRWLDEKVGVRDDGPLLTDDDLSRLSDDFVDAAVSSRDAGFQFVDIKHCHGYLGHELLSGYDRPGRYGGSLENRTRFLRDTVAGIRAQAPEIDIGVRISVFDLAPFVPGEDGVGQPAISGDYRWAFGGDGSGLGIDLTEPTAMLAMLRDLGIRLICTTAGSPYYNPHIQRPAIFPPSDGYQPPEDPLVGVARQIEVTGKLKRVFPDLILVGSGYSYLQEWLPHVGQRVVRDRGADAIGIGRMVLSYPEMPADVLRGKPLQRKRICRTFSDCTTGPRNGLISGCFPLDPFYKSHPDRARLLEAKKAK